MRASIPNSALREALALEPWSPLALWLMSLPVVRRALKRERAFEILRRHGGHLGAAALEGLAAQAAGVTTRSVRTWRRELGLTRSYAVNPTRRSACPRR